MLIWGLYIILELHHDNYVCDPNRDHTSQGSFGDGEISNSWEWPQTLQFFDKSFYQSYICFSVRSLSCKIFTRAATFLYPSSRIKVSPAILSIRPEKERRFLPEVVTLIEKDSLDPRALDIDIKNENIRESWVTPKTKKKNSLNPV